jgi:hypothetical protein
MHFGEQHMRQRTSAVAQDTMEQRAALHAPDGLVYLVGLFSGVGPKEETNSENLAVDL